MGCSQSTIENEGAVSRCRDRKLFMKEAINSRNAFAAAHSAYVTSLRNSGAALADYAHFEVINPQFAQNQSTPLVPSSFDKIPLRPPPLPDFPAAPLQRAASMPQINIKKSDYETEPVGPIIEEEEENEIENDGSTGGLRRRRRNRRGSGTSGSGYREDVAMEEGPPPPIPPSSDEKWHPSPSRPQDSTFDYIFSVDDIPGHTLSAAEEGNANEEEIMSKEFNFMREDEKADIETPVVEPSLPGVQTVAEKSLKKVKVVGFTGPVEGKRKGNFNLVQVFEEIDAHFLKASESAHEVSKMLEAIRLHYHSNFSDDRGHVDHSARVMRVITWNQSFKRTPNFDDGQDNLKLDEHETLSTVLDKLLAWEKKLSSEVKAGELMKFEYDRKVAALNKLQKRGSNSEAFQKVKAAAGHLHTRYAVDVQSMESTISEINGMRDKLLYTKLVQLVDGMATMWEIMRFHHDSQLKIASALKSLDLSQSPMETSENHHDRTIQLWAVMQEWNLQFETLVTHQKDIVKSLYSWLKLNLIPIETSLKERASSPPRVPNPPIQKLLLTWHDFLDKLPGGQLRTSISTFSALINTIMHLQEEEVKIKSKWEETRKELARKTRQFEDWYHKNAHRIIPEDAESEAKDENTLKQVLQVKKSAVEALNKRLKEEENVYKRHCLHVREKSLVTLRIHLPDLFKALSAFAHASSDMYRNLRSISSQVHIVKKNPTQG